MSDHLLQFAKNLLFYAPNLLALLVCMIICVINIGRYPRPALFGFAGFGALLLGLLFLRVAFDIVIPQMFDTGNNRISADIADRWLLYNRVTILLGTSILGLGAVLLAVGLFAGRVQAVAGRRAREDESRRGGPEVQEVLPHESPREGYRRM